MVAQNGRVTLLERLRAVVDPLASVTVPPPAARRASAVLLLFDARRPALPLLFVERTAHLRHHPGQIAFPGGGREEVDASLVDTALREAHEETGIPTEAVEVLGVLPPLLTATSDNWLTPVVATHSTRLTFRPDAFEVARTFHVDLAALRDAPHTTRTMSRDGATREVHFYEAGGNVIWGVTAAILFELLGRLDATPP